MPPSDAVQSEVKSSSSQAVPFDRRVSVRRRRIKEFSIFGKQQALNDQLWDGGIVPIDSAWCQGLIHGLATIIENLESGLGLFAIDRGKTHLHRGTLEPGRLRVGHDSKANSLRALGGRSQFCVSETEVVRPGRRTDGGPTRFMN